MAYVQSFLTTTSPGLNRERLDTSWLVDWERASIWSATLPTGRQVSRQCRSGA